MTIYINSANPGSFEYARMIITEIENLPEDGRTDMMHYLWGRGQ